ncbi:MAG: hypothetical protein WCT85_06075 [Parachlamydiales bacterium]|jgi:hypothetical protein
MNITTLKLDDGSFFNDRLVFDQSPVLRISNSIWNYILSIFHLAPKSYSEENIKTIQCFKKYLIDLVGNNRLDRACVKVEVDLNRLEKKAASLSSKHVVRILVALKDVSFHDMQEVIDGIKQGKKFSCLDDTMTAALKKVSKPSQLNAKNFDLIYMMLRNPTRNRLTYAPIRGIISGGPTTLLSQIFFDYYLSIKERLQLCTKNHLLNQEGFYEKLCKSIVSRFLVVGTIIPAYNDKDNHPQYYRVAARIVTGKGAISYILLPATDDTKGLEKIRVNKGSGFKPANIDALSYWITDFEKDIAKRAFLSAEKYERFLSIFGQIATEMGHSIGGAISQYRAAKHLKITKLFCFNSPGVPKRIVDLFNKRENQFELVIRRGKSNTSDIVDRSGPYHLGYGARNNIHINYITFIITGRKLQILKKIHPHNIVFSEHSKSLSLSGGDYSFDNLSRSYVESIRWLIGGHLLSPLCIAIQKITRKFFISYAEYLKGLDIEDIQESRFVVRHVSQKDALIRTSLLA